MMYVNKIIMLYTLNLYSAICQLYCNKTRRKNKEEIKIEKTSLTTRDNNFVLQSQKEYEAVKSNENWTKSEKDFKRLIS